MARLALMVIDSAFLGHLGTSELAGSALATLWTEFPLFTVWGMASAQIALCGQAYGTKNYALMGIWLQMTLILISILAVPTTVYFLYVDGILRLTTDDAVIIELGARFAQLLSPSIWPLLAYVCLRQYLQAMGVVLPTTINGIVCIGIDPIALFLYAFVYKKYHRGAWGGWKLSELTWSRWKTFFRMALPLGLNDSCDLLGAAALSFVVAKMGANVIATNAVLSSVWTMVNAIFIGIGLAAEVGLAEHLGEGRPRAARARAYLGFAALACVVVIVACVLWFGRRSVVGIFTTDERIVALYTNVLSLYVAAASLRALEMGFITSFMGMGQMGFVMIVTIVGLWGVQLPLAYYFGNAKDLGLWGVWIGSSIAIGIKVLILMLRFRRIDWQKMAAEAMEISEVPGAKISSTDIDDDDRSNFIYVLESPEMNSRNDDKHCYHLSLI
ncbi:hypothetical protein SDRG_04758 [Saprolegnia diclina VS20]|uniref:MATE family multidrug resistance protein n=1 Tax=Saprolegnia diclina (strain VS20) TaxID=1156394 RepID=T0QSN8_SAPDV|nr:hypothetical protein SDRG_04758 [Saprolegnia diclina VS20]EQC37731.1 hypothetical protein SDRG_04758 [Saprolegnia diclina VS20]|eukprot:XP_008608664.1 hypothetical protein SDRG_04758 [Saprolegnia diclina VS20]